MEQSIGAYSRSGSHRQGTVFSIRLRPDFEHTGIQFFLKLVFTLQVKKCFCGHMEVQWPIVQMLDKIRGNPRNKLGRIEKAILYLLGVSDKFNQGNYRCISHGLGFRLTYHSFIQTKGVGNSLDFSTCICDCHTPYSIHPINNLTVGSIGPCVLFNHRHIHRQQFCIKYSILVSLPRPRALWNSQLSQFQCDLKRHYSSHPEVIIFIKLIHFLVRQL